MTTASRKASNDPSVFSWTATMAVSPAAGPLTLVFEPLRLPTTIPPMMPAKMPEKSGAPDARATPRHSGNATRKTTVPLIASAAIRRGGGRNRFGMFLLVEDATGGVGKNDYRFV